MMKLKKVAIPAAALAMVALAVLAVTAVAANTDLDGKFTLGGGAQKVVGGLQETSVDLTSNCGTPVDCGNPVHSFVAFTPKLGSPATYLADIKVLSTSYNLGATPCTGVAPKFLIVTTTNLVYRAYIAPCYLGWQTTVNFASLTDTTPRWSLEDGPGLAWSTVAADVTNTVATICVFQGGGTALQSEDVTVDNFTVNDNVMGHSDKEGDHH